ncbi:fatty acyl-AMP ligase [Deefgea rivuli]|uniref:fatty acyl-AMP ligase n=1 Tax=Deefgea rivuli TaxID=400948 RepID=UPI0006844318|nr:fatty acyl-AMP ligase [Deefgea rivuli]
MNRQLPLDSSNTILECLEYYAKIRPEERAYTFLVNGDEQECILTYGDLRSRAVTYGQHLRDIGLSRQAVLLLFPSGLDFIIAFFACAYAGAVSVPANLARNSQHYARLRQIIMDSEARAVLTTRDLRNSIGEGLLGSGLDTSHVALFCEFDAPVVVCSVTLPAQEQLAFLQYTSGSTGDPKGVMITHAQLLANERVIQRSADLPEYLVGAGWLPQFHDMGLIGATLQPVALGGHYVFMSPLHFLQRPLRWLKMISHYRAVATAAPNFALELCVKAQLDTELETLDLSTLSTIFCGAEPVNADAIERFEERFSCVGLRNDAIKPCYGLAEATLMVSGGAPQNNLRTLLLSRDALTTGLAKVSDDPTQSTQVIVCCGRPVEGHRTIIVDPATGRILNDNQVGEVWFSGGSVASGYWRNPAATIAIFKAMTACGDGPFMRSGDLGFLHNEGLFITGRIKELIIFRGRNLYPHDIESTLIKASAIFSDVQAAVFATDSGGESNVVAYIELPRRAKAYLDQEFRSIAHALRFAVAQVHDVHLRDIYFLSYGKIPRTSSGKTQRNRCAAMYASSEIDLCAHTLFSTRPLADLQLKSVDL